jgi:hypothetical protein
MVEQAQAKFEQKMRAEREQILKQSRQAEKEYQTAVKKATAEAQVKMSGSAFEIPLSESTIDHLTKGNGVSAQTSEARSVPEGGPEVESGTRSDAARDHEEVTSLLRKFSPCHVSSLLNSTDMVRARHGRQSDVKLGIAAVTKAVEEAELSRASVIDTLVKLRSGITFPTPLSQPSLLRRARLTLNIV